MSEKSTMSVQERHNGEVLTHTDVFDDLTFTSSKGVKTRRISVRINAGSYVHLTEEEVKTLIDHLILWRDTGSFLSKRFYKEATVWELLESMYWAKQIHNTPLKMKLLGNIVASCIRASASQSTDDILMKANALKECSLKYVVRNAFDWDNTPEGVTFWGVFKSILMATSDYKLGQSQFWNDLAKTLMWYDASDGGANE